MATLNKSTFQFKHLCNHFSKNFSVGTHYRGLKRYKNCFVASDAVSWLRQELKTNKFKAMMNRCVYTELLVLI